MSITYDFTHEALVYDAISNGFGSEIMLLIKDIMYEPKKSSDNDSYLMNSITST